LRGQNDADRVGSIGRCAAMARRTRTDRPSERLGRFAPGVVPIHRPGTEAAARGRLSCEILPRGRDPQPDTCPRASAPGAHRCDPYIARMQNAQTRPSSLASRSNSSSRERRPARWTTPLAAFAADRIPLPTGKAAAAVVESLGAPTSSRCRDHSSTPPCARRRDRRSCRWIPPSRTHPGERGQAVTSRRLAGSPESARDLRDFKFKPKSTPSTNDGRRSSRRVRDTKLS